MDKIQYFDRIIATSTLVLRIFIIRPTSVYVTIVIVINTIDKSAWYFSQCDNIASTVVYLTKLLSTVVTVTFMLRIFAARPTSTCGNIAKHYCHCYNSAWDFFSATIVLVLTKIWQNIIVTVILVLRIFATRPTSTCGNIAKHYCHYYNSAWHFFSATIMLVLTKIWQNIIVTVTFVLRTFATRPTSTFGNIVKTLLLWWQ